MTATDGVPALLLTTHIKSSLITYSQLQNTKLKNSCWFIRLVEFLTPYPELHPCTHHKSSLFLLLKNKAQDL